MQNSNTVSGGGGGGGGSGTTGGNGGHGSATLGVGGAGGTTAGADGGAGSSGGTYGAGGGGGGAHGYLSPSLLPTVDVKGGDGGGGGHSTGGGGGGGGGGNGVVVNGSNFTGIISTIVAGGNGGHGGNGGSTAEGGSGGRGGEGLYVLHSGHDIEITGTITGGNGGNLGSAGAGVNTGYAGNGANAVWLYNSRLAVTGTVSGGNAGAGGPANGGHGVYGENVDLVVTGTIRGGINSDSSQALAVRFTGGTNSVTIEPTASFVGGVQGAGNDAIVLSGATDGSIAYTTQFNGFSELVKNGTSAWTLTGSNFTGNTTINSGRLEVDGQVGGAGATTNVVGGTLGGTGTIVGTLNVGPGAIHAPGNSIGTQTVNGPYILQAGSILEIEVNAAGQSDLVIVNGTVDITGAALRVLAENGNYAAATDYLIIDNDGVDAVVGTFAPITSNLAFLTPSVSYTGGDGNDVVLTMTRNSTALTSVADTPNQTAVAGAMNGLPPTNPLVNIVLGQSAEGARQSFDALSGEVHATLSATLARDSRFTRNALFARLQQAFHARGAAGSTTQTASLANTGTTSVAGSFDAPMMGLGMGSGSASGYDAPPPASPLVFWTQAFGSWGDTDGDGNAATAKRTIGGFLSGVDTGIGYGWRAGAALGYSRSNVSVSQRISSAEIDSYHLAAYTGGPVGAFALRGGASWSWSDIDTERTVVFPGFLDRVEADYDGDTGQIFGEIALPLTAGGLAYEPFAGLAYAHVSTDRFTEQGGAAALDGFGGSQDVGFSTLGIRFAATTRIGGTTVTPRASIAWQHAFGDTDPTRALAFASGAPGMTITGVPLARNAALIEAGLDISLSPSATLGISYNGEIASDVEDHGVTGRMNWRF
ncbi:autotransporter domain-containing protein [Hyphomicrobium nitrativorans]|uniref:autotransporter family protein n=1 Tax=Hyphomicrobium nitrativorans TaxID=1427356 RepID=UPI00130EBB8B|nr:autotransporter domain-containing protein [Hyphomicrobium nitrativorans]